MSRAEAAREPNSRVERTRLRPNGETSMSLRTQKEQVETDNRRLYPRGVIRGVVLVFFGLGKWGKLINISEGGMAFEFYQPPPSDQPISFALEEMGFEAADPSGQLPTDSIHTHRHLLSTPDLARR